MKDCMRKRLKKLLILGLAIISITACSEKKEEYKIVSNAASSVITKDNKVVDPFNTVVNLICYSQETYDKTYDQFNSMFTELHKQFDSHNEYIDNSGQDINNVYTINKEYGTGNAIKVNDELFELLKQSIEMCKLTKGYFNPTVGNLTDVWQYDEDGLERFSSLCLEGEDPAKTAVTQALESVVPYTEIENVLELDEINKTIKFNKYNNVENVKLNLGAIAKGFAVELVKQELEKQEKPLMISGGTSSSYALFDNPNPDRNYWNVGIAAPYPNVLSVPTLLAIKINGTYTLSVSGDYEKCYYIEENGVETIRHHIVNPHTGYPENNKRVISLWSNKNSGILDALSTALFSATQTEIPDIINAVEEFYNMSIEYMYEVEVSDSKVDIYGTETYLNAISYRNSTYFNEEHKVS